MESLKVACQDQADEEQPLCHVARSEKNGKTYIRHQVLKTSRWLPTKVQGFAVEKWIVRCENGSDFALPYNAEGQALESLAVPRLQELLSKTCQQVYDHLHVHYSVA